MPRRLARQCLLPVYSLPAHAVLYWYVLRPLGIMFEKGRGAGWYDAAVSGTAVHPPPSLSLSLVYDAVVSGTAVPTLPIVSAAARGCSRARRLS